MFWLDVDVTCEWEGKTGVPRICRIFQPSYQQKIEPISSNQDIYQIRRAPSADIVGHRRADQDVKKENFQIEL
jgi:hypothetical protein